MPDSPTPPAEPDMAQTPPALPDAETRFQAPKRDADVAAACVSGSPGTLSGLRCLPVRPNVPAGVSAPPSPVFLVIDLPADVLWGRRTEAAA